MQPPAVTVVDPDGGDNRHTTDVVAVLVGVTWTTYLLYRSPSCQLGGNEGGLEQCCFRTGQVRIHRRSKIVERSARQLN